MIELKNDRFLRTIKQESTDVTPIWIMRQAGRYLPEYRKTREKAGSFMQLCKTPELACEVTLQPLARFPLDAAILFSDILTIPDAMGLGLHFIEGEGPQFSKPLRHERDILALTPPNPEEHLQYVLDAIRLIRKELDGRVPLIGFCGSPWTLATYMVEGRADKNFPTIRKMMNEAPELLHTLLKVLAESVALHLNAQIDAGAEAVMIFDTWGGILTTPHYQAFSLHYIQQIVSLLKTTVPLILFTKGGGQWLEIMSHTGSAVLGVDWEVNLADARKRVGNKVALQGNLNPSFLHHSDQEIEAEVARILEEYGHGSGHIFNLGHGITPDVAPEKVAVLVNAVHELSRRYHE